MSGTLTESYTPALVARHAPLFTGTTVCTLVIGVTRVFCCRKRIAALQETHPGERDDSIIVDFFPLALPVRRRLRNNATDGSRFV